MFEEVKRNRWAYRSGKWKSIWETLRAIDTLEELGKKCEHVRVKVTSQVHRFAFLHLHGKGITIKSHRYHDPEQAEKLLDKLLQLSDRLDECDKQILDCLITATVELH